NNNYSTMQSSFPEKVLTITCAVLCSAIVAVSTLTRSVEGEGEGGKHYWEREEASENTTDNWLRQNFTKLRRSNTNLPRPLRLGPFRHEGFPSKQSSCTKLCPLARVLTLHDIMGVCINGGSLSRHISHDPDIY